MLLDLNVGPFSWRSLSVEKQRSLGRARQERTWVAKGQRDGNYHQEETNAECLVSVLLYDFSPLMESTWNDTLTTRFHVRWIGLWCNRRAEMGFPASLKFSTQNAELRDVRKQSREAWATRALLGERMYSMSPWRTNILTIPERLYGNLTLSLEKIDRWL